MKNIIKVLITKTARRSCGHYTDNCECLLGTALTKKFKNAMVSVGYDRVYLNGALYSFSEKNAKRLYAAYDKPKSKFQPFTVTLSR